MGFIQRNILSNVALSVSQVLFPLLVFPYVSRVIGPSGIGSVAFVDGITQWCVLVAALGIPIYGVREIAKVKDNSGARSQVFSELLTLHLLSVSVLTILFILTFMHVGSLAPFRQLFWVGAGILFANACLVEWLFQGMGKFPFITLRTVAVRAVVVLLVFLMVKESDDVLVYYAITLVGVLANVSLNVWYGRKFIKYQWRGVNLRRHLRPMLVMFFITVATGAYTLLDAALLGFLTDEEQVGYYGAAIRLTKLVVTVQVAISAALVPALSFSFSKGREEEFFQLLRKSFNLMIFVGVPATVGLIITAPNVITLFAGSDFQPAIPAMRILAPTILFVGLSNVFGMQLLNPTNNEKFFLRAALVGVMVSVAANLALVPLYYSTGTAIANFATELVVCLLLIFFALRRFSFQLEWSGIAKALLASSPMVLLYILTRQFDITMFLETVLIIVMAVICYFFIQRFIWRNPLVDDMLRLLSFGFLRNGRNG